MKLRDYLNYIGEAYTPWAMRNGIAPPVICRFLKGGTISLANAYRIQEASGRMVRLEDMVPAKDSDAAAA